MYRLSTRLLYPSHAGKWARSATWWDYTQSHISPLATSAVMGRPLSSVCTLVSDYLVNGGFTSLPGFWQVYKCPSSIYRKLSSGSLLSAGPSLFQFHFLSGFYCRFPHAFFPITNAIKVSSLPPQPVQTPPHQAGWCGSLCSSGTRSARRLASPESATRLEV